jgi:hypothetical protein
MFVGEFDTAPDDGAAEPLGEDRSLRAHPPLHRVAEHQQHRPLLNPDQITAQIFFVNIESEPI